MILKWTNVSHVNRRTRPEENDDVTQQSLTNQDPNETANDIIEDL